MTFEKEVGAAIAKIKELYKDIDKAINADWLEVIDDVISFIDNFDEASIVDDVSSETYNAAIGFTKVSLIESESFIIQFRGIHASTIHKTRSAIDWKNFKKYLLKGLKHKVDFLNGELMNLAKPF